MRALKMEKGAGAGMRLCSIVSVAIVVLGLALRASAGGYSVVPGFPQLPAGLKLEACSGVAVSSKGEVAVFHRGEPPILVFNSAGRLLRAFGEGLFKSAHGLRIDADDNIWVTDNADHTVMKFSPEGRLLLTLGEKGVAGEDESHFDKPADIAFAANGDIFVADGYGNSRVVKFDRSGKFLLAWGRKGTGEGEFDLPHAIQLDSKGLVYVGDRENNRIQVFDQSGQFVRRMTGHAPFGLFITPEDVLYLADGRANQVVKMSLEGKVLASFGAPGPRPGQFMLAHGIAVGADGAIYVTEINGKRIQKFIAERTR